MTMPFDAGLQVDEEELLRRYASGDRAAARDLTLRLAPLILSLARRQLGDAMEAEDVAQEAMLRLWKIAPEWRPGEAKVTTWIYRVTLNLCTDRLRKRHGVDLASAFGEGQEPASGAPGAVSELMGRTRAEALRTALAQLPERQAQAVALRHIEGFSNPEIAEIMEIGVEAVESLTARGKRALALALSGRRAELGFTDDHE